MKLGFQPKTAQAPPTLSDFLTSPNLPVEPTAGLDAPVLLNREPSPAMSNGDTLASPAEINLNLDLLSPQMETEAFMMNPSQSPRGQKAGLSARLGNRAQPAPAVPKTEAQPGTADRVTPNLAEKSASAPARQPVSLPTPAEPVELLRLLRHPQSGQLIVEIAGRRYSKLAEIADKEIGQHILKLAAHLLAFTNGMIATDAGLKTLQAPKVGEAPMPVVAPAPVSLQSSPPVAPRPSPDVEAALLASLRAQPTVPVPPAKQERKGLFGRSKPAEVETLLPALNLAQQINEIAQARLRYSPLAATTRLEITSDHHGGILINVNGSIYHGPDDIPHPEVKELIKASIKEWERS
ncbi:MAG: hypothetical protein HYR94_11420 [Chloroflexi bacterium]|nr:hypothetical protein [Chloroflexota bacterium]